MKRIEYKCIKKSDIANLPDLGKEGWITSIVVDSVIILYRESTRTINEKKEEITKEFIEFRDKYKKEVSESGIYASGIVSKYNKALLEFTHEQLMSKVADYAKEIIVTGKPACNLLTWLNQERYRQGFKVTTVKSEEWWNPIFQRYNLDAHIIDTVKDVARRWEKEHPNKQLSEGVLVNIIEKYSAPPYNSSKILGLHKIKD